jgi:molybdate transport system ATP-binding protein
MLEVALRHSFGGFALDAAFSAPSGVTVLFGRSGSGKTTIVNAVAGLLMPDAGRIVSGDWTLLDTERGIRLRPHRRRLGYIFQEGRLFPHLTVRQNLRYGAWFAPRDAPREDMGRVVDLLGIGHLLDRSPGALSGGEKSRVAIGRALLSAPRLILADEPLAALDEARKAEILPYFERLRDEVAVPILYVSHSASEVARLATTVVALDAGRVVAQGPAAEVLGDPAVLPAGAREAGAVLTARVARHHADGLTELDAGGLPLFLPRVSQAPGAQVHAVAKTVSVAPSDIGAGGQDH